MSPNNDAQPAECKVTKFSHPFVKGDSGDRNQMADCEDIQNIVYTFPCQLVWGWDKQVTQHTFPIQRWQKPQGNYTTVDVLVDTVQTKRNGMLMVPLYAQDKKKVVFFGSICEITNVIIYSIWGALKGNTMQRRDKKEKKIANICYVIPLCFLWQAKKKTGATY